MMEYWEKINNPEFWEKKWQEEKEKFQRDKKRRDLNERVEFWNQRAPRYARNTMGDKARGRREKILRWMEGEGVKLNGASILDLGAGPGNFAISFAERARKVVALEPAGNMTDYLFQELEKRKIDNVEVIQKTWKEVELEEEGLQNQFDLVFASMCPGLNQWDELKKAMECCRGGHLFISKHGGKRHPDVLEELWPEVFGEELPPWTDEVMYIMNLLYTREFSFSLKVEEEKGKVQELTQPEAVEALLEEFQVYGKEPPFPEEKVKEFVKRRSTGGVMRQQMISRQGMFLVKV